MKTPALVAALIAVASLAAAPVGAQQVSKDTVPGIVNFARIETTIACAGATNPDSLAEIKKMGFVSVINLREASETGANVDAEAAAAKAAGLNYVHLPFNSTKPDPAVAERFVKTITSPGTQPAFIHCAGGSRAASMWLIKRVAVDHWDDGKAVEEATALGLNSPVLKQFALDYAHAHQR